MKVMAGAVEHFGGKDLSPMTSSPNGIAMEVSTTMMEL
jgi:hypothetical protein